MLKKLIAPFLLPPGFVILLLIAIGGWLRFRKKHAPSLCALATAAILWIISITPVADLLMGTLESDLVIPQHADGDVILMLGGGVYDKSPDFSGTGAPGPGTMERMVTAARLHLRLGVPIVISGGKVYKTGDSVAKVTHRFLMDLGIPPSELIIEERSRDTFENALYCKAICEKNGFSRPLLVTSGYHIKRALLCFKKVGLDVRPFPCAITTWPHKDYGWQGILPSAGALQTTAEALHERWGLLYYSLRY